jgi:predicted nucleotidyltransferase
MSLAGFDHVFASAVEVNLTGGLTILVAPLIVTALLEIVAKVDDPHRRAKDLQDKGSA